MCHTSLANKFAGALFQWQRHGPCKEPLKRRLCFSRRAPMASQLQPKLEVNHQACFQLNSIAPEVTLWYWSQSGWVIFSWLQMTLGADRGLQQMHPFFSQQKGCAMPCKVQSQPFDDTGDMAHELHMRVAAQQAWFGILQQPPQSHRLRCWRTSRHSSGQHLSENKWSKKTPHWILLKMADEMAFSRLRSLFASLSFPLFSMTSPCSRFSGCSSWYLQVYLCYGWSRGTGKRGDKRWTACPGHPHRCSPAADIPKWVQLPEHGEHPAFKAGFAAKKLC